MNLAGATRHCIGLISRGTKMNFVLLTDDRKCSKQECSRPVTRVDGFFFSETEVPSINRHQVCPANLPHLSCSHNNFLSSTAVYFTLPHIMQRPVHGFKHLTTLFIKDIRPSLFRSRIRNPRQTCGGSCDPTPCRAKTLGSSCRRHTVTDGRRLRCRNVTNKSEGHITQPHLLDSTVLPVHIVVQRNRFSGKQRVAVWSQLHSFSIKGVKQARRSSNILPLHGSLSHKMSLDLLPPG